MRNSVARRSVIMAATLVVAVAMITTGILAYLIAQSEAENDFYVAHNTMGIVEEFEPPSTLEPNSTFTKKVQVENTGTSDCYVRVFAEFTESDAAAFATIMYEGVPGFNEENWTYDMDDGYWYYSDVLAPGDLTAPLFDAVEIGSDASLISNFDILVYAESVQSSGYGDQAAAWAAFS